MEYYSILEIEKTATKDEIKKSYRKLAMMYHPDRNKGDKEAEKKFKEINEAYGVLSDENKRKQYDMFWKSGSGGNPFWWGFSGGVDVDLWDIFESFFWGGFSAGGNRKRKQEFRWEDIEHTLSIDLKTSILGGKETIKYKKRQTCSSCKGEWGSGKKVCSSCGGSGKITKTSQSMFGMIQQTVQCPDCSGTGETFEKVCEECHGNKRIVENTSLEVEIPAGIDTGMVIKINEEGNDGVGTKAKWDLYLRFDVKNEEKWLKRDGVDLFYDIEIEIVEAVLWTSKEISVPILWKRKIDIKAGTQSGSIIKISGDGVKYIDKDKKGDLFIKLQIKIPKKLSKSERKLYEEIAKEKNISISSASMIDKIFG